MKDFDPEQAGLDIDKSHNIQLVASVSFDRQKRQFNYDNFDPEAFDGGVENFGNLKQKQDAAVDAAVRRFDAA